MRKAREPNDKLDRATDRTLAEADRKALRGLWRYNKLTNKITFGRKLIECSANYDTCRRCFHSSRITDRPSISMVNSTVLHRMVSVKPPGITACRLCK